MAPSRTENISSESNGSQDCVSKISTALWTLEAIPGKGKGLIARKALTPGTLILSDSPLLKTDVITSMDTVEKDLARALRALPKDHQRAFLSLHNNFPGKEPLSNIVRSNGYPLGPTSGVGGVFPNLSRVNHSCRPNAKHSWNPKLQIYVVHLIRPVVEGQEITVSYLAGGDSKTRQEQLKEAFNFSCTCELCSLPAAELKTSDGRLIRAESLNQSTGDAESCHNSPEKVLKNCKKLCDIYELEGVRDDRLPNLFYDCFQVVNMHSDLARASTFAEKYCELKRTAEGEDSADLEEMRSFINNPEKHGSFGSTQNWKSSVGSDPKNLSSENFERWLWREAI